MTGSLHIISGIAEKRVIPLESGRYTIGRARDVSIQIASQQVSRSHAEVIVEHDGVSILDCGSSNGTAINGRFVTTGRLKHRDQITIGEVVLEYRNEAEQCKPAPSFVSQASMYAAATKVIGDKLKPKSLWPMFTIIFGLAFLIFTVAIGFSFRSLFQDRLAMASMQRAQSLVHYLSVKNREDLKLKNELLLDVDSVLKEKGVRQAMILDPKGKVLAPLSRLNQVDHDPFTTEALAHNSDRSISPSPRMPDGTHIFVHPIRAYDDRLGRYRILGVAKIIFSPEDAVGSLYEASRLMYLWLGIALMLGLVLAWTSSKLIHNPLTRLTEKIQLWRSGQLFNKESAPFKDWAPLYEAVDQALEEAGR